jgi:hypothetical protein
VFPWRGKVYLFFMVFGKRGKAGSEGLSLDERRLDSVVFGKGRTPHPRIELCLVA